MSESQLWDYLRSRVPGVDWVRVENPVGPGTPDVNYCLRLPGHSRPREGWLELKYKPQAPKRKNTSVFSEDGLNPEQKLWIKRRIFHGGRVWIVAGVGRTIFFIPGVYSTSFNQLTFDQLVGYSQLTFNRGGRDLPHIEILIKELLGR